MNFVAFFKLLDYLIKFKIVNKMVLEKVNNKF